MIISNNNSFHDVNLWYRVIPKKVYKMESQISIKSEYTPGMFGDEHSQHWNLLICDIYRCWRPSHVTYKKSCCHFQILAMRPFEYYLKSLSDWNWQKFSRCLFFLFVDEKFLFYCTCVIFILSRYYYRTTWLSWQ